MEILVSGASHREAPVELRERLARGGLEQRSLVDLATRGVIKEGLVISTCNRLEIVAAADDPDIASFELKRLMARSASLSVEEISASLHEFRGLAAVQHLFEVASGLDSQVLGEAQILGQVKEAYRQAVRFRTVGPMVSKLFHKSFQAAKRVRSQTELAFGAVSVASAAIETAQLALGSLKGLAALVIGAGEMASAAAAHLKARGVKSVIIASRSSERARALAGKCGGLAVPLEELSEALAEADILISAAASDKPVVTLETMAFRAGRGPDGGASAKPLAILDLGLPRNVRPEVGGLPGVTLKDIDDFKAAASGAKALRSAEAEKARAVIAEEVAKFSQWLSSLSTSPTIKDLIRLAEEARMMEVERTTSKNGFSPEQVEALEAMSRSLVRRILHNPLAFVKGCHRHGRSDHVLDLFRRVFGLDP
jgi:glutamyl-tRNA reductase